MKIYVASSWRNSLQPTVVALLRDLGHDVYDFRNPPSGTGFSWRQVNPEFVPDSLVSASTQKALVGSDIARNGYASDMKALTEADACVYVLPCGRSASWELGFAMGMGKPSAVYWTGEQEPELMFSETTILSDPNELTAWAQKPLYELRTPTGPWAMGLELNCNDCGALLFTRASRSLQLPFRASVDVLNGGLFTQAPLSATQVHAKCADCASRNTSKVRNP